MSHGVQCASRLRAADLNHCHTGIIDFKIMTEYGMELRIKRMPRKNNIVSAVANISRYQFLFQRQIIYYVFQRQTEFRVIHFVNSLPGKKQ